jgi:glucose dehydrogenase
MAETCIECDVAIIGSGFAGALIANELAKQRRKVVILEAGAGIPPNINQYMQRFYTAPAKVPESPYTPELFDPDNKSKLQDPTKVNAGRPTVLSLARAMSKPDQNYLVQTGKLPFASTYDRIAGGTSHWLGTCLRLVPNDFRMKKTYGRFLDWPIDYKELNAFYCTAEHELGVSADLAEQRYLGIEFPEKPEKYDYPMPKIPNSMLDRTIAAALDDLSAEDTSFLGMGHPVRKVLVRGVPAARNSQPFKNRRACAGNTNCIPICPIQAKYDPTITLNEAINTGFVTLLPHRVASDIVLDEKKERVSQINFIRYASERGRGRENGCIRAQVYVIAANAIETPRLLLMSKNNGHTPDGVANNSGQVGKNLMDHPYYVAWGLSPTPVFPYRGPLITSGIGDLCDGDFRRNRAAFRVDIGNEGWNFVVAGGEFGADPNVTTIDFVNGTNASRLNLKEVTGLGTDNKALLGTDLARELNSLISRQFRIGFLVEQEPESTNLVKLSTHRDGLDLFRPEIQYNLSDYTKRGIFTAHKFKDLLFKKLGARDFTKVGPNDLCQFDMLDDKGQKITLTYTGAGHIMGTYRMGTDPEHSVVDEYQRSHDHRNLYLVGSGVFPTGATANPTLTIAALCLRTAKYINDHEFRPVTAR